MRRQVVRISTVRMTLYIDIGYADSCTDSEEQKETFKSDDSVLHNYCRDVEGELNKRFTLVIAPVLSERSPFMTNPGPDAPPQYRSENVARFRGGQHAQETRR